MILTSVGIAKLINATLTSVPLDITHMAVGDSGGSHYSPTQSATSLKNEVWRGTVHLVEQSTDNPNWIVVEAVIPTTVGGFTARELGLIDAEGDLIAIGKIPETYKPIMEEGSAKDLYLKAIIEASNASSVVMKVDPSSVIANRKYVDDKIQIVSTNLTSLETRLTEHLDQTNPHAETVSRTLNVGASEAFKTIQNAIDSVRKNLGGCTITIRVLEGTYDEAVLVSGFENGDLTIDHTSINVKVTAYDVQYCGATININSGEITTTSRAKINIAVSTNVSVYSVRMQTASTFAGVSVGSANVHVLNCAIAEQVHAINAHTNAEVTTTNNSGNGNVVGLAAWTGGSIKKAGTQPTGTTAESAWDGGNIR